MHGPDPIVHQGDKPLRAPLPKRKARGPTAWAVKRAAELKPGEWFYLPVKITAPRAWAKMCRDQWGAPVRVYRTTADNWVAEYSGGPT